MELFSKKFKPIIVDDKKLLDNIKDIRDEKSGFTLMILDIAKARSMVDNKLSKWFIEARKKYNIPKRFENNLSYDYKKKEISYKG